jgi:hypothetical protein
LAFFSRAAPALAVDALPRKLLVLYNSREGTDARKNLFFEGLQVVANYYGLLPEYMDVCKRPLPDDAAMREHLGLASVFNSPETPGAEEYLRWFVRQAEAGKKLLVFEHLGAIRDAQTGEAVSPELLAQAFAKLGLIFGNEYLKNPSRLRYAFKAPGLFDFERPLPPFPPVYQKYQPASAEFKTWLSVTRVDQKDSESSLVGVGPNGGVAMESAAYWDDRVDSRRQWRLNPFAFMEQALGLKDFPALTATTLNGLRVAFSHIDGDAFSGFTELDRGKVCGDVIYEEILSKYPFPVTASVIVAEIDPSLHGSQRNTELARKMFRLPNVEPASHTFSHPFFWSMTENVATGSESELMERHGYEIKGYSFDPVREIVSSCEYIQRELAPPDKPCKLLLWSGNCLPTAAQIKICDDAEILNMNGGDTVLAALHDSLFYVAPPYRNVDGRFQIYTGQANENILTNLWTGPFFGFSSIVETMKRTESPRRLAPIDIYYHFYSGEKHASVQALKDVYDWVLAQEVAPVFTSAYVRMVLGFLNGRLARLEPGVFEVSGYGQCLSLRFDASVADPDLNRCENVLGYVRLPQGLFVHLAPGKERAVVALRRGPGAAPARPYLTKATGWVHELEGNTAKLSFRFECFGKGKLALAGLEPDAKYRIRIAGAAERLERSNESGELALTGLSTGRVEAEKL